MLSVGDNLIHDGIYEQAKKRSKNGGYDFHTHTKYCLHSGKADLATINQETIIAKAMSHPAIRFSTLLRRSAKKLRK